MGAEAVVNKDVSPYAIFGGVPANTIDYRFSDQAVNKLLFLKWWDLELSQMQNFDFSDIEDCINKIEILKDRTSIHSFGHIT